MSTGDESVGFQKKVIKTNSSWWEGGSVYQIYPRSFKDSNDDGIGDLRGIISKLDYVKSLNVDALWICPFYQSPMVDFGYDVSDYRKIDPMFGDIEVFKELLTKAHQRDLKVIVDLVLSHTSEEHEWFKESVESPDSKYGDYYVWYEGDKVPNNWLSVFGGPAWTYHEKRKAYYLHNFLTQQPDLNLHNPLVQEELINVAKYWLDFGVDGFRLDACNMYFHNTSLKNNPVIEAKGGAPKNLVQDELNPYFSQVHQYDKSQPDNIEFLSRLRAEVDKYENKYLIGEIFCENIENTTTCYTKDGKPLHSAYNFSLLVNEKSPELFSRNISKFYKISPQTSWSLSNHDVTRVVSRWKDRNSVDFRAKAYNALLAGLPGTIILYQGEELGLEEAILPKECYQDPFGSNIDSPYLGRDGCRTPIPWESSDSLGGFSNASPWLPIISEHLKKSVKTQISNNNSVLCYTQKLLKFRSQNSIICDANIEFVKDDLNVIHYIRKSTSSSLHFCFNFGQENYLYKFSGDISKCNVVEDLSFNYLSDSKDLENSFSLKPSGIIVLETFF